MFVAVGLAVAGYGTASAAPPPLPEVIQRVQAAYEAVSDLRAEFSQETRYEGFETTVESVGNLTLKKPGKLRWDYREPSESQVIVNDGRIWLYTAEQKQVIIQPFSQVTDSQLPLHLLTGTARLDRDFEVSWTGGAPREDLALTLVPRDPKANLSKIEIQLDPKRYLITHVTLFEQNGNVSSFRFKEIKTNVGAKDSAFVFKAPKGTEVIEAP